MPKARLYLVAMPIGDQLTDTSLAALRALERTKRVFVEIDPGFVRRLREHRILGPDHDVRGLDADGVALAKERLDAGESIVVMPSSGLPCFLDPGAEIVDHVLETALDRVELVPLGMSSALDAALAMCGADLQKFFFAGHFPTKHGLAEAPPRLPVVCFVQGGEARAFVDAARRELGPWHRVVLFGDLRKKSRQRIVLVRDAVPDDVTDGPDSDWVAVVRRYPGQGGQR